MGVVTPKKAIKNLLIYKSVFFDRDSFLSILAAVDFVKEHFGVAMERPEVICRYSSNNNQCIGRRCPFSPANH